MNLICDDCAHGDTPCGSEPCLSCTWAGLPPTALRPSNWQPAEAVKEILTTAAPDMVNHPPHWQAADAPVAETHRASILREAERIVTQDRNTAYGEPEDCFGLIAAYWSAHLHTAVSASDVAVMMALLKLARINANLAKQDSWVDAAGYIACGAEIALKEPRAIITDAYNEAAISSKVK